MNQYTKKAIENYPQNLIERVIHPVSMLDAQIVNEVYELFKKLEFQEAVDILSKYKQRSDEDVVLDLVELNTNLVRGNSSLSKVLDRVKENLQKELGVEDPLTEYMELESGEILNMGYVHTIRRCDYEFENSKPFCIIINELPNKELKNVPFYSDKILEFLDQNDRDVVFNNLVNCLKERGKFYEGV